jgi:lysophospholipase L1-like esterase
LRTRFSELERAAAVGLSVLAALVSVMCAAGAPEPVARAPREDDKATPPASVLVSASPSPQTGASTTELAPSASVAVRNNPAVSLRLPHFFAALGELGRHERKQPVRVLWFGDSHTAADWWVEAVRKPLGEKFGNGGPGFVMVGLDKYRHAGVRLSSHGKWRREPSSPWASTHQLDGIFGLGGMRVVPQSADARASIELTADASKGPVRFIVYYRASKNDTLRLGIRGESRAVRAGAKSGRAASSASPIRRVEIQGPPSSTLELGVSSGAPQVFGVAIERVEPGVVVDTLGINGARVATALSWDTASFQAEVRDRGHELFVIAYGTNEAVSTLSAERYGAELGELVSRLRQAGPDADCLILGPPDMAAPDGGTQPRLLEFDAAARTAAEHDGCAFLSTFSIMGGEGSYARWAKETPPLAGRDNVHLSSAGYQRVGRAIAEGLLDSYRAKL